MRARKLTLALPGVLALVQSFSPVYRCSQFDDYLKQALGALTSPTSIYDWFTERGKKEAGCRDRGSRS